MKTIKTGVNVVVLIEVDWSTLKLLFFFRVPQIQKHKSLYEIKRWNKVPKVRNSTFISLVMIEILWCDWNSQKGMFDQIVSINILNCLEF